MALSLNSNILSSGVIRRLETHSAKISKVFERLSSGQRINSASDDAAGLAVSTLLNNKARIFQRGYLNLSDASSYLSIAEGAFESVSQILVRMNELAQQSANGSLSNAQRATLDKEYQALDKEIRRISRTTKFNGIDILSGKASSNSPYNVPGATNSIPSISPNGRYIGYASGATRMIYDTETHQAVQLDNAPGVVGNMRILSNGNAVADIVIGGTRDLYFFDRELKTYQKLTNSSDIGDSSRFAVSADGNSVVFTARTQYTDGQDVSQTQGVGNTRINVLNLTTGIIRAIGVDVTSFADLAISPNGNKIALLSTSGLAGGGSGITNIFSADVTVSGPISYTALTNHATIPTMSIAGLKDNGEVIFSAINGPYSGFNFHSASTSGVTQLSDLSLLGAPRAVSMTLDGSDIHFLHAGYVYTFNVASQETRLLSNTQVTANGDAVISRDGGSVFYKPAVNLAPEFLDTSLDAKSTDFEAGYGAAGRIEVAIGSLLTAIRGIGSLSIGGQETAQGALDATSLAIQKLAAVKGTIGAGQSRIESGLRSLQTSEENYLAASSRITDADIAEETAQLTKIQILQEVSTSLLTQANLQPNLVLDLLAVEPAT